VKIHFSEPSAHQIGADSKKTTQNVFILSGFTVLSLLAYEAVASNSAKLF
jgi:hypothetical protein